MGREDLEVNPAAEYLAWLKELHNLFKDFHVRFLPIFHVGFFIFFAVDSPGRTLLFRAVHCTVSAN